MVVTWLPSYCGNATPYQAFWHDAIMVDTPTPDVTQCFKDTVMTSVTAGVFVLLFPPYLGYLHGKTNVYSTARKGALCISKLVMLAVLALFWLCITVNDAYRYIQGDIWYSPSSLVANALNVLVPILAMITVYRESRKGVHNSTFLIVVLTLHLITASASLWSSVVRREIQGDVTPWDTAQETAGFVLFFIAWLLVQFVDKQALKNTGNDENRLKDSLYLETTPLLFDSKEKYNSGKVPGYSVQPTSPEMRVSFLSRAFGIWCIPFLVNCCRRVIHFEDVYGLPPDMKCRMLIKELEAQPETRDGVRVRLVWRIFQFMKWKVLPHYTLRLIVIVVLYIQPFVLKRLLLYIEKDDPYLWKGGMFAVIMFLCNLVSGVMIVTVIKELQSTGTAIKSALTAAIFRKILRLSNDSRLQTTVGQLVNYISVDCQRIQDTMFMVTAVFTVPFILLMMTASLWQDFGYASLTAPALVMLVLIPFNGLVAGNYVQNNQIKQMKQKDKRLRLLSEMLGGVKILKLYSWEDSFLKRLLDIRNKELRLLRASNLVFSVSAAIWNATTYLVITLLYTVYMLTSAVRVLTPDLAFVSSAFIQLLQTPAAYFTAGISFMAQSLAAIERIDNFLSLEEVYEEPRTNMSAADRRAYPIQMSNACFTWSNNGPDILHDINMTVKKGSIVAVVGHVGSGKTSIISTLLKETIRTSGLLHVEGSTAYVPQQPWIQNRTLKDNILMNQQYKATMYNRVLDVCALRTDLEILVDGDLTEIGQKGINLSGGQKQRVSLARAVYQNKDIYLLDDPLSAVDSHVAKHLFQQVIGPSGVLKNKTRILVSNNVSYLPQVDHILMLVDGHVIERGTFAELMEHQGPFSSFVKGIIMEIGVDSEDAGTLEEALNTLGLSAEFSLALNNSVRRQNSHRSMKSQVTTAEPERLPRHVLVKEEVAEHGAIKLGNLKIMWEPVPRILVVGIVVFYSLYLVCMVLGNIQLSRWTSLAAHQPPGLETLVNNITGTPMGEAAEFYHQQRMQLATFFGIIAAQLVTNLVAILCLTTGFIRASRVLHERLLTRVFNAPMTFFDTTPIGRILNRLSRDIDILDFNIPAQLRVCIMYTVPLLAVYISIAYTNVFFLAALVPVMILFSVIVYFNLNAIRQLRRLESVRLSPLLVHFDDAVSGISSVKAYRLQEWFIDTSDTLTDQSLSPVYLGWVMRRFMGVWLQALGGMIVFITTMLSVMYRGDGTSGDAGMSISVSLQAFTCLTNFVNSFTELNSFLVAMERINEYSNVDQEVLYHGVREMLGKKWPDNGHVNYKGYSARYRPGLDLALNQLDLDVLPRQKVAVVGRTGAGKSSLSLALFRIFNAAEGGIFIDGTAISKVQLKELRSRLTIIPQDPVVFAGSLRMNLDPYEKYTDSEIWISLEQAHLGNFVRGLAAGLQYDCGEGGEAVSLGQRQLLCLARALLRKSRVLVLDEATAAVDPETDELIQNTIRNAFRECTIITIAHRLTTILDYDRIGVMDAGRLVEYDSPTRLLQDSASVFYSMALAAGIVSEEREARSIPGQEAQSDRL